MSILLLLLQSCSLLLLFSVTLIIILCILQDGECKFKPDGVGATAVGCMNIRPGFEEDLKAAVATIGPISVNIDSNHRSFQLYKYRTFLLFF